MGDGKDDQPVCTNVQTGRVECTGSNVEDGKIEKSVVHSVEEMQELLVDMEAKRNAEDPYAATRQEITEEMDLHKQWDEDAKSVTMETLPQFVADLMNKYEHDYGTVVHAISAGMKATFHAMNSDPRQGGITGFQASFLMWDLIREFAQDAAPNCGRRLVSFGNMLYPNYGDAFKTEISAEVFEMLQAKAKELLAEQEHAYAELRAHWQSIVDGVVPFGWSVKA